MLTSKDLMIGDWFAFQGHPYKCTASDIEALTECEEKGIPTDISEIPITPEILKNNGFKDGQFFAELLYREWQIMCDCAHLAMRHEDGWFMDIRCHYIHELQHALRLCGIEKEIEL